MWWEGLFKQHLGRKGFLFSHCHGGSLMWRKHTRITTRQERFEVTTQPHGYKQDFCHITVKENQHKSNTQQCCFPTTWNDDLPWDFHFLILMIFSIYIPTSMWKISRNMQTVGRVMIILPIARLRHTEVKGWWFFRSSINLVLFPQPLLPPSPLDLLGTLNPERALSGWSLWRLECVWPFQELTRNPALKWEEEISVLPLECHLLFKYRPKDF